LEVVLTGAISPPVVEVLEICGRRYPLRGNYSEKKAASQHGQRQARPSIHLQLKKIVPLQAAGFNPGEVLRKPLEHRFQPGGQTPRIGVWVKDV
jgi:hypothetical protein